jgi:hypothetical protein
MFQFWFNTFFVEADDKPISENGRKSWAGEAPSPSNRSDYTMIIPKLELDIANKDKAHKLFSPYFKVGK